MQVYEFDIMDIIGIICGTLCFTVTLICFVLYIQGWPIC